MFKKPTFKFVSVFCVLTLLAFTLMPAASAISYTPKEQPKSASVLLVNRDIDQTVYEKDPDSKRYPASTTKIMTYIIVAENVDDIDNTRVQIKKSAFASLENTGSSLANMEDHIGDKMTVKDLLYCMMVPSGNDASLVLADYVGGGDIKKFVQMMNDKAAELGCENTHFANPDGLHDPNHYTTARDLYKITSYALKLPRFVEITNTTEYYCEGDDYPLITTNYLIDEWRGGEYYYKYAKGIKTGTTDEAGRCLVTTASADGHSYIAVILGAPYKEGEQEEYYTFLDAAALFRWALVDLELQTVKSSTTPVCEQKIKLVWGKDKVSLVPEKDLNAIVPTDTKPENIVVESDTPEEIDAPVTRETVVGKATVYYIDAKSGEKQPLATVNLVPDEELERSGFLAVVDIMGQIFRSYWFLVVIGFIALILIIYFIVSKIQRKRRRDKRKVKRYRNF